MDNPLHKELIASNLNGFNGLLPNSFDRDCWWLMPEIGRPPDNSAMLVVTTQPSPLPVMDTRNDLPPGGVELSFDRNKYELIKRLADQFGQIHLTNFALDQHTRAELFLKPEPVLAPDATIVIAKSIDGVVEEREVSAPDMLVLKGWVKDAEESQVFLAISPLGTNGWIYADGTSWLVSTAHGAEGPRTICRAPADNPAQKSISRNFECDVRRIPGQEIMNSTDSYRGGASIPRRYDVAIDTDNQYLDLFQGQEQVAIAYAMANIGAANIVFEDTDASLQITYMRLWEGEDPWPFDDTAGMLDGIQYVWNASMSHIERDMTIAFCGPLTGGGVAYGNSLCNEQFAYGVIGNMNGYFSYDVFPQSPDQGGNANNWDCTTVTHEIGHVLGAVHTHEMDPPYDNCGNGDCDSPISTVMSYCHLCEGGEANVQMLLCQQNRDLINNFVSNWGGCGDPVSAPRTYVITNFFMNDSRLNWRWERVLYYDGFQENIVTQTIQQELLICSKEGGCIEVNTVTYDPRYPYLFRVSGTTHGYAMMFNALE